MGAATYDVYLGASAPPALYASDVTTNSLAASVRDAFAFAHVAIRKIHSPACCVNTQRFFATHITNAKIAIVPESTIAKFNYFFNKHFHSWTQTFGCAIFITWTRSSMSCAKMVL